MIHTPYIQYVIDKIGAKSYLEIGINKPEQNHYLINCQFKIGVDPNPKSNASFTGTSDDFFEVCSMRFDVIFIDGLHFCEQVKPDFINSINYLTKDGVILIHDTDPKEERFAVYPRTERGRWNGDVYKFITRLPVFDGWDWRTPEVDPNGLTVVKRSDRVGSEPPYLNCDFKTFKENRNEILQSCTMEEFKEWISKFNSHPSFIVLCKAIL